MPRLRPLLVLVLACAITAGCVQTPTKEGRQVPLEQLTSWRAKGKLGVITAGKASAVNFDWQNDDDIFEIRLYGLLGLGNATLTRDRNGIELVTREERARASSADELLLKTLGWHLPVQELVYWIKGMPSPQSPVVGNKINDTGSISYLEQQGWRITYPSYHEHYATALPKKIIARRQGVKLTIAIKSWQYR